MPVTGKFDILVCMEEQPMIYFRKQQRFFKLNSITSLRLPVAWVSVNILFLMQTVSVAAGSISSLVPTCFVHQWHWLKQFFITASLLDMRS